MMTITLDQRLLEVTETDEQPVIRRAVSLFSNCGVGDFGYRNAGFQFAVVADVDERRLEVAQLNHPEAQPVPGDLRRTWRQVVQRYRNRVDQVPPTLLAACPPCQGMSSAFSDRGESDDPDTSDERNLLVVIIARVTQALQPKLIVVENVTEFLTRKVRHPETKTPISAAKLLISTLELDYAVFPLLTNLAHYGVPQNRHRTFLTFVRRDLHVLDALRDRRVTPYPQPTHDPEEGGLEPITLRAALDSFGLPFLDAKSEATATSELDLHFVPIWDDRIYRMVAAIPANSGRSAWENGMCSNGHEPPEVGEHDVTCPICKEPLLRPVIQENDGTYRLVKGFRSSSYRRMHPDRPAATVTTASGRVSSAYTIHPFENRVFSPLECAHLQTIPEDFSWGDALGQWGHTNVRKMIGEAVPPRFTKLHGEKLVALLNGDVPPDLLSNENWRVKQARDRLDL